MMNIIFFPVQPLPIPPHRQGGGVGAVPQPAPPTRPLGGPSQQGQQGRLSAGGGARATSPGHHIVRLTTPTALTQQQTAMMSRYGGQDLYGRDMLCVLWCREL